MSHYPAQESYLFVDGNYVKKQVEQIGCRVYGRSLTPHWERISSGKAAKAFYYDAYPEKARNERDKDFEARLEKAERDFGRIASLTGWHVNFGITRGEGRKLRQKGVDVKLALDAVAHRAAGNFRKAIIVTGDLDFLPLIRALVEGGAWVELWCDERYTPKELIDAADQRTFFGGRAVADIVWERDDLDLPKWQEIPFDLVWKGDLVAVGEEYPWQVELREVDGKHIAYRRRIDRRTASRLYWEDPGRLAELAKYDMWFCKWHDA